MAGQPWPLDILESVTSVPRPFEDLPWPEQSLRIFIVAPHPDDFDAIAISLRWLMQQGHELFLCILSGGSKGVQDSYQHDTSWAAKAKLREQEQRSSCALFGLPEQNLQFLHLPEAEDGELDDSPENQTTLSQALQERDYDMVMLPYGKDTNTGHQRTYRMVKNAVMSYSHPILTCCNKDAKTLEFQTHVYMGFNEDEAEWKGALLRCHDSQHARNLNLRGQGFDDRVLQFNRTTAASLPMTLAAYAEAFYLEYWQSGR